jgi:hypothetical protein
MIDLLSSIVAQLVCWIETGGVDVINAMVVAIAAAAVALFAVLPSMPAFPTLSGDLSWFYWLVPVSTIASVLATGATLYAAVVLVQIALRWVKAL